MDAPCRQSSQKEHMESILNDLQIYVCHEMCRPPEMTEDERKQYCRGCWFEGLVEEIIEEYEKKIKKRGNMYENNSNH